MKLGELSNDHASLTGISDHVYTLPVEAVLEHQKFRSHNGTEYSLKPGVTYTIHFDLSQGTFRVTEKGK